MSNMVRDALSPIGSPSEAGRKRREESEAYRREQERVSEFAEIAELVILYRTRHDLTQLDLARLIGTSHSAISRLESGQHKTSVETLRRIAQSLGLHLKITFEDPAPAEINEAGAGDVASLRWDPNLRLPAAASVVLGTPAVITNTRLPLAA